MSLDVGDQVLLLLERVHDGHVTEFCGFYFDNGERIRYGAAENALQALVETGRLALTYPPGSGVLRAGGITGQKAG